MNASPPEPLDLRHARVRAAVATSGGIPPDAGIVRTYAVDQDADEADFAMKVSYVAAHEGGLGARDAIAVGAACEEAIRRWKRENAREPRGERVVRRFGSATASGYRVDLAFEGRAPRLSLARAALRLLARHPLRREIAGLSRRIGRG